MSSAILSFFLGIVYIFILHKILAKRGRLQPFFAFAVILVKFSAPKSFIFSVVNMGYKLLKKRSKYEVRIFLDEKQRFSVANFLHLFIQVPPLTHSALVLNKGGLARATGRMVDLCHGHKESSKLESS